MTKSCVCDKDVCECECERTAEAEAAAEEAAEEAEEAEEEATDTEPETRTPHNDVWKYRGLWLSRLKHISIYCMFGSERRLNIAKTQPV